jgi:uncharacterized DUF497 family protein
MKSIFESVEGFEWDKGNILKNKTKHGMSYQECEEVFRFLPLLLGKDILHSIQEERYYVLGKTASERKLFLAFTVRLRKIRIISARDMSRKERMIYAKEETSNF